MEFGEQLNNVSIHPLTGERWRDFEALFGARGACAGCWCMWWRLTRAEFQRQQGEGNRQAIKAIVASNREPGLLAYVGDVPAGWCAVAPPKPRGKDGSTAKSDRPGRFVGAPGTAAPAVCPPPP